MARIRKFHLPGCSGGDCDCLWELDYRPLGMYGPRRRVRFQTRKAAERFQAETALQAARGEYVEPARVPTFAEVAEDWFQSKTDRRPSARASSGSRSCSSSVDPLMSAKSAVTVLRSPSSCAPSATMETRTEDFKVSLVSAGGGSIGFEHSRQNFARGGFSLFDQRPHEKRMPHAAHLVARAGLEIALSVR